MKDACLRRKVLCWILCVSIWSVAAAAAVPINPPSYTEMSFEFDDGGGAPTGWQPISGAWSLGGGTYNSTTSVPTALTTVDVVSALGVADGSLCHAPCMRPFVFVHEYVYQARMLNPSAAANAQIGFVYQFQDASTYYEVVFSPRGVAQLRRVQGGVVIVEKTAAYLQGGPNLWFDVELHRRGTQTTVRVNGNTVFLNAEQADLAGGLLGLVTHNTTGRFENVDEKGPYGTQPVFETFDDPFSFAQITDQGGPSEVVSGAYIIDSDAIPTATSLTGLSPENTSRWTLRDFGLRADLFNPYGASGNRVGLMWNYKRFTYNEVVFTPTGLALVNRVTQEGTVTVATAPIPILKRRWFEAEVEIEELPEGQRAVNIRLNGKPLFTRLQGEDVLPRGVHEGDVGLITHWSPGRFDNVNFQVGGFAQSYAQQFNAPTGDITVASGEWETASGALHSRALGNNDIALLPTGSASAASGIAGSDAYTYTPNFVYRARLRNPERGSDSSVGLITHYNGDGDYYEAVFTGTGEVFMNAIVQGTKVSQAAARYDVPPNTWFDAEIRHVGTSSSLRVNGVEILWRRQGQIKSGRVGLVTHAAQGSFDEVSWRELH